MNKQNKAKYQPHGGSKWLYQDPKRKPKRITPKERELFTEAIGKMIRRKNAESN